MKKILSIFYMVFKLQRKRRLFIISNIFFFRRFTAMEPYQIIMAMLTILCLSGVFYFQQKTTQFTNSIEFKGWMRKIGKIYPQEQAFQKHFATFISNKEVIDSHNEQFMNKHSKYEMQLNSFSDLTNEQFSHIHLNKVEYQNLTGVCQQLTDDLKSMLNNKQHFFVSSSSVIQKTLRLPLFKDPTNKLFSRKQTILQMVYQQTEHIYNISEPNQYTQDVFNFNTKLRNSIPENCSYQEAYEMIINSNRYQSEHIKVINTKIQSNQKNNLFSPKCYYKFLLNSTNQYLQEVLSYHPLLVHINANTLQNYKGGVIEYQNWKKPSSQNNHVVMLVDAGVKSNGTKYWKLLNTWGTKWGQKGFFYLQRKQEQFTSDFQWLSFITI